MTRSRSRGTTVEWMTPKDCRKAVATVPGVDDAREQLGLSKDSTVTSRHYVRTTIAASRPRGAAEDLRE